MGLHLTKFVCTLKPRTMANNTFITTIRNLIAQNNLDEAIKQLRTLLENSPKLDEVLLQSARLQDIRKHIRQGTATWPEINLTQDQIRAGLVDLVREIENHDANPEVKAEVEKAVSIINSKNVITGSNITAGGNIIIGDNNTTQHADKIYNINKIDNANFS